MARLFVVSLIILFCFLLSIQLITAKNHIKKQTQHHHKNIVRPTPTNCANQINNAIKEYQNYCANITCPQSTVCVYATNISTVKPHKAQSTVVCARSALVNASVEYKYKYYIYGNYYSFSCTPSVCWECPAAVYNNQGYDTPVSDNYIGKYKYKYNNYFLFFFFNSLFI